MRLIVGFIDDKGTIEQMKRDRFKGILLGSFEHLSPEGIYGIKELKMELEISRDFIPKVDLASYCLAPTIRHLASSILTKYNGQQEVIPL